MSVVQTVCILIRGYNGARSCHGTQLTAKNPVKGDCCRKKLESAWKALAGSVEVINTDDSSSEDLGNMPDSDEIVVNSSAERLRNLDIGRVSTVRSLSPLFLLPRDLSYLFDPMGKSRLSWLKPLKPRLRTNTQSYPLKTLHIPRLSSIMGGFSEHSCLAV